MVPRIVFLAVACLGLFACASPADESTAAGQGAASAAKPREDVPRGKYVSPGRGSLLVYGASSEDNQLADMKGNTYAAGVIEDGVIRAAEGDLCGSYLLTERAGTVTVTWQQDRDMSAHRDPEIASGCQSIEGEYDLMGEPVAPPADSMRDVD